MGIFATAVGLCLVSCAGTLSVLWGITPAGNAVTAGLVVAGLVCFTAGVLLWIGRRAAQTQS